MADAAVLVHGLPTGAAQTLVWVTDQDLYYFATETAHRVSDRLLVQPARSCYN